ncbi:MAG: hypothetical protein AAGA54_12245 [Myxococcota bacterium]
MEMTRLYCPIATAISPHHARAREESLKWMSDYKLVRTEEDLTRFAALRIPEFVARAYPYAEYEDLRVVLDWTLWGFAADDQHDSLVHKPELLRARYLEHGEVIEEGLSDHVTSMHAALADVRRRILERSNPGCLRRFAEASREWFDSMHWEIMNRVRVTPPSPGHYMRMREVTVGMYTEYALFDVSHQHLTDDSLWTDPDVRRLMAMCANIIGWANDVFSYKKEQAVGDPHNLVLLLSADRGLSIDEAVDQTIEMHNLEMVRFLELEESVRKRPSPREAMVADLIELMRSWIRGNVDWAFSSQRYGLGDGGLALPTESGVRPSFTLGASATMA